MSKKTKQEKIIADLRRKLALGQNKPSLEIQPQKQAIPTFAKVYEPLSSLNDKTEITTGNLSLIKKDLTKTLILSILAISFELVLYFVLGTGTV